MNWLETELNVPYHIEALEGLLRGLPIHVYYMTKFPVWGPCQLIRCPWFGCRQSLISWKQIAKYTLGIQVKVLKIICYFSTKKQFYWCSKEPSQWDGSFEHPKQRFKWMKNCMCSHNFVYKKSLIWTYVIPNSMYIYKLWKIMHFIKTVDIWLFLQSFLFNPLIANHNCSRRQIWRQLS